jgi:hypothetical protein
MPVGWREPWSFKTLAPGVPTVTPTAPPAPTATATPTRTPVPNRAPVIKAIEVVRYDSLPSQIWYKVDAEDDAVAASQLAWQWTLTAACGEFLYRPDNYYDQIYQFSGCAPAQVAAARITVTVTDAQGARATYSQLARENENKGWVRVG